MSIGVTKKSVTFCLHVALFAIILTQNGSELLYVPIVAHAMLILVSTHVPITSLCDGMPINGANNKL